MLKRNRRSQGLLHSILRPSEILIFQLIASNPIAVLGDDSIVSISVRLGKLSFFCPSPLLSISDLKPVPINGNGFKLIVYKLQPMRVNLSIIRYITFIYIFLKIAHCDLFLN